MLNRLDDVSVAGVHVRVYNLPDQQTVRVGKYRTRHLGKLLLVRGKVGDMDGRQSYVEETVFERALCGTVTRMPQSYGDLVKPTECMGVNMRNRDSNFHTRAVSHADDGIVFPPEYWEATYRSHYSKKDRLPVKAVLDQTFGSSDEGYTCGEYV